MCQFFLFLLEVEDVKYFVNTQQKHFLYPYQNFHYVAILLYIKNCLKVKNLVRGN